MKRSNWLWAGAGLVGIAGWVLLEPYGFRLVHFRLLNKDRVVREAEAYVRDRTRDPHQKACLYVVRCDGQRARLERVTNTDTLDFEALKRTIWHRRTDTTYCPGRTVNIALHLIPDDGHDPELESTSHAVWSFYNNRFIPRWGRFHSSTFSDQPWEACTPEVSLKTVTPPKP